MSLDGPWGFAYDDEDAGRRERWHADDAADRFDRDILVPFAPESPASGIGDPSFHPVVWYRRVFAAAPGAGRRLLLHVGAVDYEADVWVDGAHVGAHRGGQSSFTLDITDALRDGTEHAIVLRASDDPGQSEYPRGKQDWLPRPHDIWYERTTGIWRSVWLEEVPRVHVVDSTWLFDPVQGRVDFTVELNTRPPDGWRLDLDLRLGDEPLGAVGVAVSSDLVRGSVDLPALRNAQHRERYLWSPERPRLVDIGVVVAAADGAVVDEVATYCGLRTVGIDRGRFLLNDRPCFVRSVLEQGYWPASHFTAPDVDAYRAEVELIKSLGFNAVRVHQKTEDPRFHYWADRLGLMVWGETASAYGFSERGASAAVAEWSEIVARYRGHPSIVTWVPVNESWGVQDLAHDPRQRSLVAALTALTRALDPHRPVVSNDGWEHVDSDILTVHDYTTDAQALADNWSRGDRMDELIHGMGPSGRRLLLAPDAVSADAPVMVTEFGGISYAADDTWGYATVESADQYERLVGALFAALRASRRLAGFCYTQLTDTLQEANGLLTADRAPKLPIETLRRMIAG